MLSLLAVLSPQLGDVGAVGEVGVSVILVPWTSHTRALEDGGGCRREKGDWSPYTGVRAPRDVQPHMGSGGHTTGRIFCHPVPSNKTLLCFVPKSPLALLTPGLFGETLPPLLSVQLLEI